MGIRSKLFLIFLSTFLVLILAASGFYFLAFSRSLNTYLDERQQEQVERLANHLGRLYQQQGSWQFLLEQPDRLKRLYRLAGDRKKQHDKHHSHRQLQLLGANRERLMGPPPTSPELREDIAIKAGPQVVGWLTYPDRDAIRDKLDKRFIGRQLRFVVWMLSVGVALSLLVSWLLSRHLVAPILALSRHTRALQDGDYQVRLAPSRKDELGMLAQQVNELAERLDQGQQARQRWFSDIAHELRTPVSILRGELEAVLDGVRPTNRQSLQGLESEVSHLTHLINDLHDLALADAGNLRYHFLPVDWSDLIGDVLEGYTRHFQQMAITLDCQAPDNAVINGDPVRLRQLLDNLLQNSLKYTHAQGRLEVRLYRAQNDWLLTLADSAPGVPDSALPHLFDHLYRVDSSRNRRTGGAGLGLAICQRIVQAHGGQISAAESPLGGLAITVRLPGV